MQQRETMQSLICQEKISLLASEINLSLASSSITELKQAGRSGAVWRSVYSAREHPFHCPAEIDNLHI
jgi:hypothetical protein